MTNVRWWHWILNGMLVVVAVRSVGGKEMTMEDVVAGMTAFQQKLQSPRGTRIVYHQFVEPASPTEKNPRRDFVIEQRRQDNGLFVNLTWPSSPEKRDGYAWYDGVCVHLTQSFIAVEPSYNPAISQITSYTNYLFIDVSPPDATVARAVYDVFQTKAASPFSVLFGLPRSVVTHSDFKLVSSANDAIAHLQRPGRDDIYLDTAHGFVCVARRCQFKPGAPLFELESKGIEEVSPGLWLPREQIVRRFAGPPAKPSEYGTLTGVDRVVLRSFEFVDLTPASFALPLPKARNVYDRVRRVSYRLVPDDMLPSDAINEAIQSSRRYAGPIDYAPSENRRMWILSLNVIVVVAILILLRRIQLDKQLRRLAAKGP